MGETSPETVTVRFEPRGPTVEVAKGTTVLEAARLGGCAITAPCGGRGVCGGCGVRVVDGSLAEPDEAERVGLRRAPADVRLACRATFHGPATLRPVATHIPNPGSLFPQERRSRAPVAVPTVAAVDLGTSTVAAVVIEAETRAEVGRSSVPNRQSTWGADVLSRVSAVTSGEGVALREALEASVLDALEAACVEERLGVEGIERLVIAGNPAISSMLLGLDVTGLGAHPFRLPYTEARSLPTHSKVVSSLAEGAQTLILPPLAGFVGGDALAGLIAEGLDGDEEGLFVDLGTNAEVVVSRDGRFVAASAAAGPAFEAGGISSGGPAAAGAIERVGYDTQRGLVLQVIGGVEPGWLCGSGLLSAVALLRRLGHLASDGLLSSAGPLEELFFVDHGVRSLRLASARGSRAEEYAGTSPQRDSGPAESFADIVITQLDIRAFQLAKAAVRSAIELVLRESGASTPGEVMVAGGFGARLSVEELFELGVLPTECKGSARVVGNASLLGAAMIAVDPSLEERFGDVSSKVTHVELALEPEFEGRYVSGLQLEPWSLGADASANTLSR